MRRAMRTSKDHSMLGLESKPLHAVHALGLIRAVVELDAFRDLDEEERHAIMDERRAPLTHGAVDGIEDVVRVGDIGSRRYAACILGAIAGERARSCKLQESEPQRERCGSHGSICRPKQYEIEGSDKEIEEE